MDIIIAFLIFGFSILVHEIGHILFALFFSKELPHIRFRKSSIMIVPTKVFSTLENKWFLGGPIIMGMISLYPFFIIFPIETWAVFIAYMFSCSMDFINLMKLEVKKE